MSLELQFDMSFVARLALREKQVQQSYRPIIGVHKWFARRPGTVFRSLLLSEFANEEALTHSYWRGHQFKGVVADPFMGGGTPIYEAVRLGFSVVGADVNPMAYWIVRQSLSPLDLNAFSAAAEAVATDVERIVGDLYQTLCIKCEQMAEAKYFLWVKTQACPTCGACNDLFPGYLLAEATRHPLHVVSCGRCGELNEYERQPTISDPLPCRACDRPVTIEGPAKRNRIECNVCRSTFRYPASPPGRPEHRLWAIEYHCARCKPSMTGRFFKRPDADDLAKYNSASLALAERRNSLPLPDDEVPSGDESDRLHRWGYRRYSEMFNDRQLLGLGTLLCRIRQEPVRELRHALLTVFSDFLRYQNMLCRYDTYALKCQDIFSVHGFPVGLVQCENNLLGIRGIGSGAYRHFVEKYLRAKRYAANPFDIRYDGGRKHTVLIKGEKIEAKLVARFPEGPSEAYLVAAPATQVELQAASLDGVFTDPPYFDNVQYAELMDFCFHWLRIGLEDDIPEFRYGTTRAAEELTGNVNMGRGIEHFTAGLSAVFCHYAYALKPGAPFVFTYHHNDPGAYVPLVVAILDAGLDCSAALAAPAEMGASLHIARTGSSVLDTVFVCRAVELDSETGGVQEMLRSDIDRLSRGGVSVTEGDIRCLLAGHLAKRAVNRLRCDWKTSDSLAQRMSVAKQSLTVDSGVVIPSLLTYAKELSGIHGRYAEQLEAAL